MSLKTSCSEVRHALDQMTGTINLGDKVRGLTTRKDLLQERQAALQPLSETLTVFRFRSIPCELPARRAARLNFLLRQVLNAHAGAKELEDKDKALIGLNGQHTLIDELKEMTEQMARELKNAWEQYTGGFMVPIDSSVLEILESVPELAASVGRIRTLQRDLQSKRLRLPRQDEDVEAFLSAIQNLQAAWNELGGDQLPDEVREFIRLAGTSGVGLNQYTEPVARWLTERDILSSFEVQLIR